jgi:hypothetical protein
MRIVKILITGSQGYVGSSVIPKLKESFPYSELFGIDLGFFQSKISNLDVAPEILLSKLNELISFHTFMLVEQLRKLQVMTLRVILFIVGQLHALSMTTSTHRPDILTNIYMKQEIQH